MKSIIGKLLRFHGGMTGKKSQFGGAALEYIMVTTFAAIIGIAALGYTGKAIKEQLKRLGEQMGITEEPEINLPFSNSTN